MAKLTPAQQVLLNRVTEASLAHRNAKATALEIAKLEAAGKVAEYARTLDREIRLAYEGNVPKSHMLRKTQGVHTTAPAFVAESLARTAGVAAEQATREPVDPLAVHIVYNAPDNDYLVTDPDGCEIRMLKDGNFSTSVMDLPTPEWNAWHNANRKAIVAYLEGVEEL